MEDRRKTGGLKKLVTDGQGRHKLGKWITVLGAITLSGGFIKEATTNHLEWLDYIGYAVGMTVMYAPSKATDLIYALKGMPQHEEKEEQTVKSDAPVGGEIN